MTRKEIFEKYGIRMIWKPSRDCIELSDEDAEMTERFAQSIVKDFEDWENEE